MADKSLRVSAAIDGVTSLIMGLLAALMRKWAHGKEWPLVRMGKLFLLRVYLLYEKKHCEAVVNLPCFP